MDTRKRWHHDDGRYGPFDLPSCPIQGLDRIPAKELPEAVSTVFFGGGWFPLAHYVVWKGYQDWHYVFVSPFYISLRPVSIGQWKEVMGDYKKTREWERSGDSDPAKVDWDEAIEYCNKLSAREGLQPCYSTRKYTWKYVCDWNANGYRLPSEAEFNYATPFHRCLIRQPPSTIPSEDDASKYENAISGTSYYNLVGAYDWTMFWDYFDPYYFRESPQYDPTGPEVKDGRCWNSNYHSCRYYPLGPIPSNNAFKLYRKPGNKVQFYTARSWIVKQGVCKYNQAHLIPQWDRELPTNQETVMAQKTYQAIQVPAGPVISADFVPPRHDSEPKPLPRKLLRKKTVTKQGIRQALAAAGSLPELKETVLALDRMWGEPISFGYKGFTARKYGGRRPGYWQHAYTAKAVEIGMFMEHRSIPAPEFISWDEGSVLVRGARALLLLTREECGECFSAIICPFCGQRFIAEYECEHALAVNDRVVEFWFYQNAKDVYTDWIIESGMWPDFEEHGPLALPGSRIAGCRMQGPAYRRWGSTRCRVLFGPDELLQLLRERNKRQWDSDHRSNKDMNASSNRFYQESSSII